MRPLLKKLIPPIFLELRDLFRSPRMEYAADGWKLPRSDYNEDSLVQKQLKKFRRLVTDSSPKSADAKVLETHELNCAQIAALIAAQGKARVRILDFGGALGVYCHFIKKVLPANIALEYHISEVPKICAAGRRLMPNITFHENTLPKGHFELVMISGSLQYIQDWQGLLRALPGTDYLYLPRTPVTEGENFTVKDYFGGVSQPIVFEVRNRKTYEAFVTSLGFEKLTEFAFPAFPAVKSAPAPIFYSNCLFRRTPLSGFGEGGGAVPAEAFGEGREVTSD